MEQGVGFVRLMNETQGMSLKKFDEWLKRLTLEELDHIVFATEHIAKQAIIEMGNRK